MPQSELHTASSRIISFAEANSIIDAVLSDELDAEKGQSVLCKLQFLGNREHDAAINTLVDQLLKIPRKEIREWERRLDGASSAQAEAAEALQDLETTILRADKGAFEVFQGPSAIDQSPDVRTMNQGIRPVLGRPTPQPAAASPVRPDAQAVAAPRSTPNRPISVDELRNQLRRDLHQKQRASCPLNFEHEKAATEQMVRNVRGIDPNGNIVDILPGLVKVDECTWEGSEPPTRYPTIYLDLTVYMNPNPLPVGMETPGTARVPVYFHSGYVFHPGAQPKEAETVRSAQAPTSAKTVHIVDTGWPSMSYRPRTNQRQSHDVDPFEQHQDVVWGHGPAIVDAVDQIVSESAKLTQVRYFEGWVRSANLEPAALLFPTPDGSGDMVRGFDGLALLTTLQQLSLGTGDVVNLSLGTVACVEDMLEDPVADWIEKHSQHTVVVAAGNHGFKDSISDPPSFPAAYAPSSNRPDQLSTLRVLENVRSVGSADDQDGEFSHDFSAKGAWVTHWQDGEDVPVEHPGFDPKPLKANATWLGTSFAAPRFAANLI